MVKITATYDGALRCTATHGPSGSVLSTDAPKDNQGLGASFSPTDLVATALATCMLTTMDLVARREGIALTGMRLEIHKQMASDPRRIAALPAHVTVPGRLTAEQRQRLEATARGCPVARSLHQQVDQTVTFSYPDCE